MAFDPYEVLGVPRDATESEIKRAAKDGAKKSHPDAGGNADAFAANRRALAILSDPNRRARFDSLGDVDEPKPDNKTATAMDLIFKAVMDIVRDQATDPRTIDIVRRVTSYFQNAISQGHIELRGNKQNETFLQDIAKRFKRKAAKKGAGGAAGDFIVARIEGEIRRLQAQRETTEREMEVARIAIELVQSYEFSFERPTAQAPTMNSFTIDFP